MSYKTYRAMQIAPEIDALMDSAIDETGEIVNEVALAQADDLIRERSVLLTDLAAWVKWAEQTRMAEIDARIEQLQKDKSRFGKAVEFAKKAITANLKEGDKLKTDDVSVSWRKAEAVIVTDAAFLPERFQRVKTTIEADKKALKEALTAGEKIAGVSIETRHSLVIK